MLGIWLVLVLAFRDDAVLVVEARLVARVAILFVDLLVAIGDDVLEGHTECALGDGSVAWILRDEPRSFSLLVLLPVARMLREELVVYLFSLLCLFFEVVVVLWLVLGHLVQPLLEELHLSDLPLFLLEGVSHLVFLCLEGLCGQPLF